jgi:hypothetical protein
MFDLYLDAIVTDTNEGGWRREGDTDGICFTPTKKLTKGGVLRKRQTSSLARFHLPCVQNALLEMVNGALEQKRGVCLTLTGYLSRRKALTFSD